MVNVAIVGAGYIGRLHACICKKIENVNVVAIIDTVKEKAIKLANEINAKYYTNMNILLDNKNVDIVAICTPTYTHAKIVKEAANSGKNIFCEKPFAISMMEANEMVEATKMNKIKSMVGHVLRFWPEYVRAREIVKSGDLGKPLHAFCERLCVVPNWAEGKWNIKEKMGGGAALDLQIHDLDYLIYLFGKPDIVESQGIYDQKLGGLAHISTNIRFKGSQCGLVNAGWAVKGKFPFTMSFRIICENGVIEWIFRAGVNIEERSKQAAITIYKSDGSVYEESIKQADPYYLEWKYFIDCLENNKEINNATFEDASLSLKLALASIDSAKKMKAIKV